MNIYQTVKIHLPPKWRLATTIPAFVRSIVAPLQTLSNQLDAFKTAILYDLAFDGRVVYLEHWLNDLHDISQRRIYIGDPQPSNILPNLVFNKSENQPTTIVVRNYGESGATTVLYNRSELATKFDFVIFIPLSIWTSEKEKLIRSQVNRKKQAGKMFAVQTF